MAHAHDKTLLAQLGFADPDKHNPKHDLACRYLAQELNARRLITMLTKVPTERFTRIECGLEQPLTKGTGQYKTLVGFLDLRMDAYTLLDPDTDSKDERVYCSVIVEVKIGRVPLGEILRQVRLYQEYVMTRDPRISPMDFEVGWVVATAYTMTRDEVVTLVQAKIGHIHLGPRFDAFVAGQRNAQPHASPEF